MTASHTLDRVAVTFDDTHAVADAGLILPATLAQHLGLRALFDTHVDLGAAAGHANVGHKAMTLIHSALADGDSIDDADALRSGATGEALGHAVRAPSTLGTFLRSFTFGHARQLDVVSGELLARAWAAGAGPGSEAVTVDVDSSIVETYGLAKQGGAQFTYNHVRGYHPLVAVIAATGDVVHSRLRGGNAHSGRGPASFLAETFGAYRPGGGHRAAHLAGRLRFLQSQGRRRLPQGQCRVLDHGQDVQGIAHPDCGDRRGPVGPDPVLQ
ncbi:MAG: transposase [Actinomycetota bacterium]|nr:transposase [Actinomycetota bacterium]